MAQAKGGRPALQAAAHGTVLLYRRGCRCLPCRAAAANESRASRERRKKGVADFTVSSEIAAEHLWDLSRAGMGLRAVSEVTGICRRNLYWIRSRKMRIRQSTEERIMRVHTSSCGETLKSGGAWMWARNTNARVDEMLAAGWSKMAIARAMGYQGQRLDWHGQQKIRVRTMLRFVPVYRAFKLQQRKAA